MLTVDEFRAMKCRVRVPKAAARCFSFRDRPGRLLHIGNALWLSPSSLAANTPKSLSTAAFASWCN